MPLQLAAGRVAAGPAEFVGADWSARLQRASYDAGAWQTAGSLRALPVAATLAEFPEVFAAVAAVVKGNGEPLRINGEWDLGNAGRALTAPAAGRRLPSGSLRLWRDRGDLAVGTLPLGLEEGLQPAGG